MAYNLQPLITILEQILNPEQTRWIFGRSNKLQFETLLEKAVSLQQILEKSSFPIIESLKSQIREATNKAEDMIESEMVDQMLSRNVVKWFVTWSKWPDLQQVTQQLDSAMEQVAKIVEEKKTSAADSSTGSSITRRNPHSKSVVVGVEGDLMQLKDRLTGMERKLEIVPIVGMGGIGKTTLARKLYQDSSIISHFQYARAWTTISQDYNLQAILPDLLRCIIGKEFDDKHAGKKFEKLRDVLYQSLYGRRYLIVLDDVWNIKFWDEMKRYFPDNNNGSRIVMTTRESDVAKYADSRSPQHQVQLLSESDSWDLLGQIVFGEEENCPRVLQGIGRKIASDCGGLPLAIDVIGGLLSKVERSVVVWENIANDVRGAIFGESEEQFSNILSLSYDHLPNHLKPCFLYMGAFPGDYEIKASRLIRLWVAEGFIKSSNYKSLEEEAEDYLKALAERNLVLMRRRNKYYREARSSNINIHIHDLLRDVCMKKADEEKFLNVLNKSPDFNTRRMSIRAPYALDDVSAPEAELMSLARSLLSNNLYINSRFLFTLKLLSVLDVIRLCFTNLPIEILQLVNLRYLGVHCYYGVPVGISRLQNLQTLIVPTGTGARVPFELWELSELRHLKFSNIIRIEDEQFTRIGERKLLKLQTLSPVSPTPEQIKRGFFESIPNIKKLTIYSDDFDEFGIVDLSHLQKLETLTCNSGHLREISFRPTLRFPTSLKRLTLSKLAVTPGMLATLYDLPNLEELSMKSCQIGSKGRDKKWEWEVEEGDEFRSLQLLQLYDCDLVWWRADESNFPRLRHLLLASMYYLREIPSGIGEIPTLQLIELDGCSASVVASAEQIVEVQQSDYANYDLRLHIWKWY